MLSLGDVERLLTSTCNPKHRALLMTTYSAGLRVSEVVRLQVTDIESAPERMLIRINQGKGKKDRYTLLSSRLLQELRAYWGYVRDTREKVSQAISILTTMGYRSDLLCKSLLKSVVSRSSVRKRFC